MICIVFHCDEKMLPKYDTKYDVKYIAKIDNICCQNMIQNIIQNRIQNRLQNQYHNMCNVITRMLIPPVQAILTSDTPVCMNHLHECIDDDDIYTCIINAFMQIVCTKHKYFDSVSYPSRVPCSCRIFEILVATVSVTYSISSVSLVVLLLFIDEDSNKVNYHTQAIGCATAVAQIP